MSFNVNIEQGITVLQMSTASSIANGENIQFGWSSHQKRNFIYFQTGALLNQTHNVNVIIDNDSIDMAFKQDTNMMGITNQTN